MHWYFSLALTWVHTHKCVLGVDQAFVKAQYLFTLILILLNISAQFYENLAKTATLLDKHTEWPITLEYNIIIPLSNFVCFGIIKHNRLVTLLLGVKKNSVINGDKEKNKKFHTFVLGPVVQSVVSLTNSLRVISLTILADSIHNILIFFAEKMWVAFALQKLLTFFQQKIWAYLHITRFKF